MLTLQSQIQSHEKMNFKYTPISLKSFKLLTNPNDNFTKSVSLNIAGPQRVHPTVIRSC